MPHHKWLNIGLLVAVFYCFFFHIPSAEAQSSKKSKKKKEVGIVKKGWDDLTTRNNYYFNAKKIYDEMIKNHIRTSTVDYNDTIPFYLHDREPSLSGNTAALNQIIIKTGVTLQRHDYSRWKDDCYTLMGKAYFLKGDMDTALITFQFVTTALRGKFNDKKAAISQKDILKAKAARKKEMDKLTNAKKKEIAQKEKVKAAETAKAAEDKKKRMEAVAKAKEKELQQKIKAKQKMMKQKAKGKYKPPKNPSVKTPPASKDKKNKKSASDILDRISEGISIEAGGKDGSQSAVNKADQKIRALEKTKEKLEAANVEDSLTQKQLEKANQLTLWEKIKHLPSRPEALVWMTKTLIRQGNYADAESLIEYSKTMIKLRKKQTKDIKLVRAYYFYNKGQHNIAAEALEETLPYIRNKKEKAYYNYLLAQLSEATQPQNAYDRYKEVNDKAKDEQLSFYALEQMYRLIRNGTAGKEDMPDIIKSYNRSVKSKLFGDKALYTLADIHLMNQDTVKSIEYLNRSIASLTGTKEQKSISLIRLGDLYYDMNRFKDAYNSYDSALVILPEKFKDKEKIELKHKFLKDIAEQTSLAMQQDSLLYLSSLSREELASYIREQNKIEKKQKRKEALKSGEDAAYSSTGIGNNANFNTSQDQYTNKGQWYFYNIDMKTRGFNEFKQVWGERPYVNNWRRSEALQLAMTAGSGSKEDTVKKETAAVVPTTQYKIPASEEEIAAANNIIEKSYLLRGKTFFEGLADYLPALNYLDSLLKRYPEGQWVPDAIFTKMLIYKAMNNDRLADAEASRLLAKYPDHELSLRIKKGQNTQIVQKDPTRSNEAEVLYASLYDKYQSGQYADVIKGKLYFYEKYNSEKNLLPKINFLEALSLAQNGELDSYKEALNQLIKLYPESDEAKQAKRYLSALLENSKEVNDTLAAAPQQEPVKETYQYSDGYHFIMFVLKDKKHNNANVSDQINKAVETIFPTQRIRASNSYLDAATPLILVKRFNTIEDAEKGLKAIRESGEPLLKETIEKSEILLISQDNFKELFTSKKLNEYTSFYQQYYKGK